MPVNILYENMLLDQVQVTEQLCCVLVPQSWLTLSDPMDCSPPSSFVHGILQARLLEWSVQLSTTTSIVLM